LDHFLEGLENGWDRHPPVRLAITEAGPDPVTVLQEDAWPPRDVAWKKLPLGADTKSMRLDGKFPAAVAKVSLPEGRLSFLWTVPEDMDVIGRMALYLHLEVQGAADALLFAGLRKRRNGREITFEGSYGFSGAMVSKGWQRAAHRDLDTELSTPERPVYTHCKVQLLQPGEVVPIAIAMLPQATRLSKGDQLRLEHQGCWFYSKSQLRSQYPASYEKSPNATCIFHTGGDSPTYLLLATRTSISGKGQ
jgi:predicted acyl esterase